MLNKVKLAVAPLSGEIHLYRHGKDTCLALEKRPAERDVMTVLINYMMRNAPKGSTKCIAIDNQRYEVRVKPIEHLKGEIKNDKHI